MPTFSRKTVANPPRLGCSCPPLKKDPSLFIYERFVHDREHGDVTGATFHINGREVGNATPYSLNGSDKVDGWVLQLFSPEGTAIPGNIQDVKAYLAVVAEKFTGKKHWY